MCSKPIAAHLRKCGSPTPTVAIWKSLTKSNGGYGGSEKGDESHMDQDPEGATMIEQATSLSCREDVFQNPTSETQ
jgi:hypothetical protein